MRPPVETGRLRNAMTLPRSRALMRRMRPWPAATMMGSTLSQPASACWQPRRCFSWQGSRSNGGSAVLKVAVVALVGLAAASFAGCEGDTTVNVPGSEEAAMASGITVSGVGEVKATPDLAIAHFGAAVSASTAADARERGAEAASKLIDALKNAGVANADIQTISVTLMPQYEYLPQGGTPRVVGYTSGNTVRVRIKSIEKVGTTIDAALGAAGDAARLQGIQFGFDDEKPLLAEARKKAVEDAKSRAEAFASGAGVKVGDILSISETTSSSPILYEAAARDLAAAGAITPIEPGQSTTTVTVTVRYALD